MPALAFTVALATLVGGAAAQDRDVSLAGAIDFHVHSGPDSRPRSVSDLEVARMTASAGLRGIVLKNHFTMTADRAALAMAQVEGLEIFGGVVLNRAVGGLNAEAVRQMVQFSGGRGKVVWLPTFDAEYYITAQGGSDPFVSVTHQGAPVPELAEIFTVVAEHDLVLAMGHSSPEEVLVLIAEAHRYGVEQILGHDHSLADSLHDAYRPSHINLRRCGSAGHSSGAHSHQRWGVGHDANNSRSRNQGLFHDGNGHSGRDRDDASRGGQDSTQFNH